METSNIKERSVGLDIVRSLAIFLVLTAHAIPFSFLHLKLLKVAEPLAFIFGIFGVEIFFVLSGYLIGTIIVKKILEDNSFFSLFKFYVRRWFRTLPLYYFVLIVTIIINNRPFYLSYIFFTQNFNLNALNAFPVTWSLTIEEWFYLLFPLVLIIFSKILNRAKKVYIFFSVCLLIILGSLLLRIVMIEVTNPNFAFGIRQQIYLRMDSIIFGVLIAGIKSYYGKVFELLIKSKLIISVNLVGFIFAAIYLYLNMKTVDNSFFSRTFLFSLIPLCSALIVAQVDNIRSLKIINPKNGIAKLFKFSSTTSYAVYLIHADIFSIFYKIELSSHHTVFQSFALWILAVASSLVVAIIVYNFLEIPFLKIRDSLKFNNLMNNNWLKNKT